MRAETVIHLLAWSPVLLVAALVAWVAWGVLAEAHHDRAVARETAEKPTWSADVRARMAAWLAAVTAATVARLPRRRPR